MVVTSHKLPSSIIYSGMIILPINQYLALSLYIFIIIIIIIIVVQEGCLAD